jgi:hypothetical protein
MSLLSRSSLWTLWFSGVVERRSLKYARYFFPPHRFFDDIFNQRIPLSSLINSRGV